MRDGRWVELYCLLRQFRQIIRCVFPGFALFISFCFEIEFRSNFPI